MEVMQLEQDVQYRQGRRMEQDMDGAVTPVDRWDIPFQRNFSIEDVDRAGQLRFGDRAPANNSALGQAPLHSGAKTHVIIVALDYPGTKYSLSCTKDGANIQTLCSECGVSDVTTLYNGQATCDEVVSAIDDVGSRCGSGDYFILYYSGHGTSVLDRSGDEADGKDEALCLVNEDGKIDRMTDDYLAAVIQRSVAEDVNVIVLADCCHSGTIADFCSPSWGNTKAVLISGCSDAQEAGDTGDGGIFTHSLLLAIADLGRSRENDYSCGRLYNKTYDQEKTCYDSKQNISCAWSAACGGVNRMAWPLIPAAGFQSPLERSSSSWWI